MALAVPVIPSLAVGVWRRQLGMRHVASVQSASAAGHLQHATHDDGQPVPAAAHVFSDAPATRRQPT